MKFKRLKGIVGALAPTIGSALGGPLGGVAMSAIAGALGVDANARAVNGAIQRATPEQLAEVQKAELAFQERMQELNVDVFRLETEDVKHARTFFAGDATQRAFGLLSLAGFLGYIFMVTIQPPDANSGTIVSLVLGYLGGLVSGIASFYFGASHMKDE